MSEAQEALLQLQALADAIRRSSWDGMTDEEAFRKAALANPDLVAAAGGPQEPQNLR